MDIFAELNYKTILKKKVKELSQAGKLITLQNIARRIPIQNTYFSKALNDAKTHLNEDHLYRVCEILEFLPDETDYVMLLRAHDLAQNSSRKSFLAGKINRVRQAKDRAASIQEFGSHKLAQEMAYLFDPMCIVVHVALFIPDYAKSPRRLASILGLTASELRQVLRKIEDMGYIELDEDEGIKKIHEQQVHYGTDHPLMRMHQNLLRQKSGLQVQKLSEADKHCFMGTFSADVDTYQKIKNKFRDFMKEVEHLVVKAPSKSVYQMNFDLFPWL